MIKVSVLYPSGAGATFDMEYYVDRHMPMVRSKLGTACRDVAVEQGMSGMTPGSAPLYACMGHLYFDSVEAFVTAWGPHAAAIVGDVPNYTNIQPTVQISEVKL
jgi:uncharacterized protein (TIGR02118 family)